MLLLLLDLGAHVITDAQVLTSHLTAPQPISILPYINTPRKRHQNVGKNIVLNNLPNINYRPGLVGLELLQNICEGRGIPRVSW